MKFILIILVTVTVVTGCTYDIAPPQTKIEKQTPWISHPAFTLDTKVKVSSFSDSNFLFLQGPGYFSWLSKNGQAKHFPCRVPYSKKLPICSNYFLDLFQENNTINTYAIKNAGVWEGQYLDISTIDPNFKGLDPQIGFNKEMMAINNKDQLLVPYINGLDVNPHLLLIDVTVSLDMPPTISFGQKKVIPLDCATATPSCLISFVKAVNDYFIASTSLATYKITSEGNATKISNHGTSEVFEYAGHFFGINSNGEIISSLNNGATWSEGFGIPFELASNSFYSVGDSLVFTDQSQLYSAKFSPSSYSLRELDNLGIEGNLITSVTEFNDSIYATTYSGVYYKSSKDFFKSRPKK